MLAIFTKYYNKWYVAMGKIDWKMGEVLGRMLKGQDAAFEEVKLEVGSSFGPKPIFCMRTMNGIMRVDSVIVD